jgi:hypothetical protein
MRFSVSGVPAFSRALENYQKRSAERFKQGLVKASKALVDAARPLAPIDTGALRASGVWFTQGSGFATQAIVGFGAEVEGFYDDRGREKIPREYAVYQHEFPWNHFYLERAVDNEFYAISSYIYTEMAKA